MSHGLLIRPEAEFDMVEGRDWYQNQATGLGMELIKVVTDDAAGTAVHTLSLRRR